MVFSFRDFKLAPLEVIGTSIQFNGQTIPPLPNGETLTYARAGVNTIAGPSSAGNAWIRYGAGWARLNGRPVGGWGVVIDETYVAWQEENAGGVWRAPIDGSDSPTLLPIPWQATGLLDMVNGVVRADDRSQPFYFIWNDVQYHGFIWMTRQGRTVMPANNLPGGVGVVVWDDNTQQLWRVSNVDTQVPPRLSEDGKMVALTGDYAQGFVPDSAWTLEPQAPVLPDIQPFTSPKIVAVYPASNGALTTHSAGMNSRIEFNALGLVALPEGTSIRPWVDAEHGDPIPSGECVVYCDISKVATIAPKLTPYQVIAFNCYVNPGESEQAFVKRIASAITLARMQFLDYILVAGAWNRGTLTDAEVLMGMEVVSGFPDGVASALGVAIFGLDRGTSIGQFKPLYQQCADLFSSPKGRPNFPVQPVPPTSRGLAARKLLL